MQSPHPMGTRTPIIAFMALKLPYGQSAHPNHSVHALKPLIKIPILWVPCSQAGPAVAAGRHAPDMVNRRQIPVSGQLGPKLPIFEKAGLMGAKRRRCSGGLFPQHAVQPSLRPILRNFSRRCLRITSGSRLCRSFRACAMASPVVAIMVWGSRCAPPEGSPQNRIDHAEAHHVLRGDLHVGGRLLRLGGVAPQDRGRASGEITL